MARKNLLANVTASIAVADSAPSPSGSRAEYAKRGASRSMMQSLDEMAENSMRVLEGETVVSLDANLLDASFVVDRIDVGDDDYLLLRDAIRQHGQSSPILVRPHPEVSGRFMIVFGHRRARVAKELGVPVRAVIKPIEDIAHVIAQGQENTARANLTFIEKSLFAQKLARGSMSKDTIKAALTVDDTLLSRMLSVVENVPETVLDAVGNARGVGRDRWEELKKLVIVPGKAAEAVEFVQGEAFSISSSDERFNSLLEHLKKGKKARPERKPSSRSWAVTGTDVQVSVSERGKAFTMALKSKDASRFGTFVAERLEELYRDFKRNELGD
ncbi:plasmid partitioning protein RepB [Ensifer sp. SL37]|uniref:plasmid partitioning protein RepB n=1 Tax=Ensifer sp. SL37 TaxID=2995137 RepID=UPI002273E94B|nr:plasmid partitioning protein RepB [Ensifer sp. SL37]MCY1740973.1 plasmid partitioning protein RepB [Ensifer sp. SL37]